MEIEAGVGENYRAAPPASCKPATPTPQERISPEIQVSELPSTVAPIPPPQVWSLTQLFLCVPGRELRSTEIQGHCFFTFT